MKWGIQMVLTATRPPTRLASTTPSSRHWAIAAPATPMRPLPTERLMRLVAPMPRAMKVSPMNHMM
jgi:hypothetical protein